MYKNFINYKQYNIIILSYPIQCLNRTIAIEQSPKKPKKEIKDGQIIFLNSLFRIYFNILVFF